MTEEEYQMICNLIHKFETQFLQQFDVHNIYLRLPYEICAKRLSNRGRSAEVQKKSFLQREKEMLQYLKQIESLHDSRFINDPKSTVVNISDMSQQEVMDKVETEIDILCQ